MKKLKLESSVLALLMIFVFYSYEENGIDSLMNDAELIATIQSATNKQDIGV